MRAAAGMARSAIADGLAFAQSPVPGAKRSRPAAA